MFRGQVQDCCKMIRRVWHKVFGLVVVVAISVFVLVTVLEPDFDSVTLPELPTPSDLLSTFTEEPDSVPAGDCKCAKLLGTPDWEVSFMNRSVPWTNQATSQELQERHPNMPVELLYGSGSKKRCSLLPSITSIDWRNRLWQQATLDINERFLLYSAFLDPEADGRASIRVLGVSSSKAPSRGCCLVWFRSDAPPLAVNVTSVDYLDYQSRSSDRQMPYLLRCPLPANTSHVVPLAVSLVSKPCAPADNLIKVIGARQRHVSAYRFRVVPHNPTTLVRGWAAAVCGPALYYYHEDFSLRLVEWLELLRAQGFSQVFLYVTDVHPNITKVLRHYAQEGFVQLTDYTYPPPYINEPSIRRLWTMEKRRKMFAQENVYFTDCVLRHMHQYRFLAHFDPDEVPILPHHDNFTHFLDDLMASVKGAASAGFRLEWRLFFNNIGASKETADLPESLWALRHTHRLSKFGHKFNQANYKPIYDMNVVRGAFSHGAILCKKGPCNVSSMKIVPPKKAFLGHFKLNCDEECKKSVISDLTLLRYRKQVSTRALKVMTALNLV